MACIQTNMSPSTRVLCLGRLHLEIWLPIRIAAFPFRDLKQLRFLSSCSHLMEQDIVGAFSDSSSELTCLKELTLDLYSYDGLDDDDEFFGRRQHSVMRIGKVRQTLTQRELTHRMSLTSWPGCGAEWS